MRHHRALLTMKTSDLLLIFSTRKLKLGKELRGEAAEKENFEGSKKEGKKFFGAKKEGEQIFPRRRSGKVFLSEEKRGHRVFLRLKTWSTQFFTVLS